MSFAFLNPFATPRTFQVQTDIFTCRGQTHRSDGIPNQDSAFVSSYPGRRLAWSSVRAPLDMRPSTKGLYIVGVFDGHGELGHVASRMACDTARSTLERLLSSDYKSGTLGDYVRLTFETISNKIETAPCSRDSGATGSIVAIHDSDIVIGHVGDSCVIVVSKPGALRSPMARHMTTVHRLTNKDEQERIVRYGGIVMNGYVIDKETRRKGMSVTRTLGDLDMHKNGCISTPEIVQLELDLNDVAIITASDGLWDAEGLNLDHVYTAAVKAKGDPVRLNEILAGTAEMTGPLDDCTIASIVFSRL